ncbi:spore maturation protein [Anaerolentibacter hominis]|uniref:spore maturation protein n=1 Tax=Anaerolentibacter hominis TaxID=3079009 RepID=UPI0031B8AB7B
MNFLVYLSDYMIPIVIFYIVAYGLLNKVDVYDTFVRGAKDGMKVVAGILPTLVGLMVAVGILRASGAMDFLCRAVEPLMDQVGFPAAVLPLIVVKMFSSSAASGLLLDLFKQFGPDSFEGNLGSVLLSSTETIFYTMSIYFMTAGVKKSRYTLAGALVATLTGIVASLVLVKIMM